MNVLIDINTNQKDINSNQTDNINLVVKGTLKKTEHFDMISYEESELTGLKGNKTVLKIDKDSLTMIRYGKNASNIYFKQDASSNTGYTTEYGVFDLNVFTHKFKKEDNVDGYLYKIKVEYDINIRDLFQGKNILEIKVKSF